MATTSSFLLCGRPQFLQGHPRISRSHWVFLSRNSFHTALQSSWCSLPPVIPQVPQQTPSRLSCFKVCVVSSFLSSAFSSKNRLHPPAHLIPRTCAIRRPATFRHSSLLASFHWMGRPPHHITIGRNNATPYAPTPRSGNVGGAGRCRRFPRNIHSGTASVFSNGALPPVPQCNAWGIGGRRPLAG